MTSYNIQFKILSKNVFKLDERSLIFSSLENNLNIKFFSYSTLKVYRRNQFMHIFVEIVVYAELLFFSGKFGDEILNLLKSQISSPKLCLEMRFLVERKTHQEAKISTLPLNKTKVNSR